MPAGLRTRTTFVVFRLSVLLRQECTEKLATVGLSMHQHMVLVTLAEFGAAVQKEVAARLSMDTGDLVRFADVLQDAGYVRRDRDIDDRRRQILTITPLGRQALKEANALLDDVSTSVLGALPEPQITQLTELTAAVLTARNPENWLT